MGDRKGKTVRLMTVDLDSPGREAVEAAAAAALRGQIVLSPTDTVYGLHCHPFLPSALLRLVRIKGRAEEKGFLLLIPDAGWAEELCPRLPPRFGEVAARIWPGPVTLLLEGHPSLSPLILGRDKKVGVRVPAVPFLRQWMDAVSAPLVSTSANLAGEPTPASPEELRNLFGKRVGLMLESRSNPAARPSSVVDLTTSPPRILRRGEGLSRLEEVLKRLESSLV